MKARIIFVALTFSVIGSLPGCGGNAIEEQPKPAGDSTAQTSEMIEVFAADAPYNLNGRHYQLTWGLAKTLPEFHALYVNEFVNSPGMGFTRTPPYYYWSELIEMIPYGPELDASEVQLYRDPRTGETSHSPQAERPYRMEVDELMAFPGGKLRRMHEQAWIISDRQLVSLLKETGPLVYQQDFARLTLKDHQQELASANPPKRPLDEFEAMALPKLRNGGELAVKTTSHELRLLGAVRAQNQCISCHKCETGTLLGAFTYTFKLRSEATHPENRLKHTTGMLAEELSAVEAIERIGGKLIRAADGKVSEVYLSYERNAELAASANAKNPSSSLLQIKNSALKHLAAFPALQILDVSDSLITDLGIPDILKLKQLRKLNIKETKITEAGIAELKRALPQCEIERDQPKPVNNLVPPSITVPIVPTTMDNNGPVQPPIMPSLPPPPTTLPSLPPKEKDDR